MATRTNLALAVFLLAAAACGKDADGTAKGAPATPTSSAPAVATSDPRGALFVEKGCPQCHTISALGIKSPAEVGPDLTYAYKDVETRFGVKLEEFLHNPTGTMQIVLSSQIQLSPAERDSVIHILKQLHEESEGDHDD